MEVRSRPYRIDEDDLFQANLVALDPMLRHQRFRMLAAGLTFFAAAVLLVAGAGVDGFAEYWLVAGAGFALGMACFCLASYSSTISHPVLRKQIRERSHLKFMQRDLTTTVGEGTITTERLGLKQTMSIDGFHKVALRGGGIALFHPGAHMFVILRHECYESDSDWFQVEAVLEGLPRMSAKTKYAQTPFTSSRP